MGSVWICPDLKDLESPGRHRPVTLMALILSSFFARIAAIVIAVHLLPVSTGFLT